MKSVTRLASVSSSIHKNRLAFNKIIKQKIIQARKNNDLVGLILISIDNFKSLNRHLGYHAGNLLIQKTLKRLYSCLNKNDVIVQIDSDELVIILCQIKETKEAQHITRKIMDTLVPSYMLDENEVHAASSIGVACYPDSGDNAQTLLQNANIALHGAKELAGHHNFRHYSNKLNKHYQLKFYLENALKFALEKKEFCIYYQPIFNLVTKKIAGVEALLRWQHPGKGLISPDIFIPLAEQMGLIIPMGEWVLQTACEQGEKWHAAGLDDFKISVNVSTYQLLKKRLPQLIMRILKKTHIPPQLLELELTETAFVMHANDSENILKKIHKTGVSISIDDFGTGHSSLTRLARLPLNSLKIDKSFVQAMSIDSSDTIIVKSLIKLGKNLGLNVTAEGIETEEHLQFLITNGCPHGQGYYLSKPLTADQMTRFLKHRR